MDRRSYLREPHRIVIGVAALVGLGIMVYLTYIHYANARSFCDISAEVSCDVVTTSIYSEIFGLPVSILGLGYFLAVLVLIFFKKSPKVFTTIFFLTLFVLIPSLYLSLLELFVIKSLCILCETSKVLMMVILTASYLGARAERKIEFRLMAPIIIAGVVASFVTYFAQTGTVVKEDYSELVECMNRNGVVYYKSFRCNSCKRQEAMLGDAYLKLNSVECHPEGPEGNPDLCLAKNVTNTPTFIREEGGVEIKRVVGLQSLSALAEFSGCPAPTSAGNR